MISPPTYFEAIRKQSADRWDQLDSDNVLAAPWHQLFKQIQSPRHVISELLQNADDAGATNATVRLDGGQFAFTHNGQDFEEQHFASLCRFGYSNKRSLHTIGFRGIGFKSTFSLGDEVRVLTPTLRVAFHRRRFTEPIWLNSDNASDGTTTFSVATQDSYRRAEIEKNSASWLESPASLLFFRSVRTLQIGDDIAAWQPHAPGPVENSEWFSLAGSDSPPVLLIRSLEEEFPEEAIAEIREERMISDSEESDLPPCAIEVVLGLEGRLYVVLPTGVCTSLPFACNGPFIQDPARLKIKDPETSPTNRWLLERVGQLAATAMLQWLNRSDLTIAERSQAYRLLVPRGRFDNSLEGDCETIISESFHKTISDEPFLLAESEELFNAGGCLAVPAWLTDVWSPEQVSTLFDEQKRPILENSIDADSKAMLASSGYLPEIGVGDVLQVLRDQHLPRPGSWLNLLDLWNALAEKITARRQSWEPSWKGICIVPVQGQECLYSMTEVVRLGEKRLLHSDDDWDFLSRHLLVMNPNWTRFIAEQRRDAEASENSDLAEMVHNADRVLEAIGLADSSEVSKVMERVSQTFFTEDETSDDDSIRLAQIAAALDANVPVTFQFIARDGSRISRGQNGPVIADLSTDLDLFVDDDWCERHVLHDGYGSQFKSCTPAEWREWIESGRSGLLQFVPLIQHSQHIYRRSELKRFLNERGYEGEPYYRYVTNNFVIDDWDYALEHWQHWETLADDDKFWRQLLNRILVQPPTYWQNALSAKAYQIATTGSRGQVGSDSLTPAWILKLRGHRCLQDTWGNFRAPAELLRRTPETEALLDVEPFVRADLDTESTRPLLARLGVRDTPTGTNNLLERLRALATVEHPPFFEVQKWCHRLDNVAAKCSTEELDSLKETFQSERLFYTSDNTWATASQVFLNPGDEAPGVPVVHEELRGLTLWQRIGVEERPTADLVIDWLQTLPTGEKLAPDDLRRVREVIARYPNRVWDECGRWLNLEGEWVSVETLRYQLSMQSLVATRHLFPPIRQQVADLQRLPYEVVNQPPFCHLASLASVIAEQVEFDLASSGSPKSVAWLTALGNGIARITFEDAAKDERTQQLGRRLAKTCWLTLSPLQTIPYIDGTPAGTGRTADAVWDGTLLYVDDKPMARLFRPIAQELGRPFEDDELADAIKTCADRTTDFINEYLALNFTLLPQHSEEATTQVDEPKTDESVDSDDPFDSPEAENVDEESDEDEDTLTDDTDVEPIDDGSGNGEINEDEPGEIKPERPTPPRPTQPPLIVRYALTQGFRKDVAQGRFYHADGRWIQRSGGQAFPWDVYSATGELVRSLWTKEHCLERDPLQLPAEIWKLCENNPDLYSLVVTMPDGKPLELSGRNLQEMKDKGHIMLFPATYRLVYQNGQ